MYLWGLLLLSMPAALLLETQLRFSAMGWWVHLPWMHAVVVYYALHQKLPVALTAAFMGGLCVDAYTVGQPGMTVLVYGLMVYLADRFRRQIVAEAFVTAAVFGVATTAALGVLRLGVLWSEGHRGLSVLRVLTQLGFGVVSAAILTPLVGTLMQGIHRGLAIEPGEEDRHVNA